MNAINGIVPWVECNRDAHEEPTIEGLKHWLEITDEAIVTTVPGNSALYGRLRKGVPRMHIIRGIKTHDLLRNDHASPEGWRRLRREVVACLSETSDRRLVFDMESTMRPVWEGDRPLDQDKLTMSIRHADFPRGVTYYWFPSVGAWRPEQQTIAAQICRTVQDCFDNLVFIDGASLSSPNALGYGSNLRATDALSELSRHKPVPLLQCHTKYWSDERVPEAAQYAVFGDEGCALLYPGQGRWVEASQSISAELIKAGLVPRSGE